MFIIKLCFIKGAKLYVCSLFNNTRDNRPAVSPYSGATEITYTITNCLCPVTIN